MDQSSFDLSNAKLTDLPETSIPSLLHRNRLIELTEHIGMHGAQVIQHLGQRHLSLMSQEPTLHDLICERNLSTLEWSIIVILVTGEILLAIIWS